MDIYYAGLTCIRVKGKKTTLVIDPSNKTEADAVLLTSPDAPTISTKQVTGYRVAVTGPGEYEVGGVGIAGFPVGKSTTYVLKVDGISILHMGNIQNISESELDRYPNIDIVCIPVGPQASHIIAKLEAKVVIPIAFDQASLSTFLKEVGKEDVKPQSKLTITREKLPAELEVIVLE